jgi:hypothetical protein
VLEARVRFEWLEGGDFLVERWEIREEGEDLRTDFDLTYTRNT